MNDVKITYSFEVICKTKKLGVFRLSEPSTERLELMLLLQKQYQMNCVEISDFLNSNNIKTPRNKIYNHKIVWGSIKKYKKRLERYNSDRIESVKEFVTVYSLKR